MAIRQVSDSELELMKIIWAEGGKAQYAVIQKQLAEKGMQWQKNTIITLLLRLVEKGMLKTSKLGHRNEYTAQVSEEQYRAAQAQVFLDKLYEGSAKGLVSTLIQQEMLSAEDYRQLREFWRKEREQDE